MALSGSGIDMNNYQLLLECIATSLDILATVFNKSQGKRMASNIPVSIIDSTGSTAGQVIQSGGSGIPPVWSQNNPPFTQTGTGAIARTVNAKLNESISVLDFGADPTGATDSTAAIQTAINSAIGLLFFPKGTYKVSSPLTIPPTSGNNSNLTLLGTGTQSQIVPAASMSSIFSVTGKNVRFSQLFLNNASSYAVSGISMATPSSDAGLSVQIDHCSIIGFTNGLNLSGQNYMISENFLQNNTNHILFNDDGRNTSIHTNYMLGGSTGLKLACVTYQAEGLRFTDNTVLVTAGGGAGINIGAGLEIYISGNIIDQTGTGSPGIYMYTTGSNAISKVKIIGNWIAAGQGSYSIFGAGNVTQTAIQTNTITTNNSLSALSGISLASPNGYQIIGNNFAIVSGSDLSISGGVNGTVFGNTSTNGASNAVANTTTQAMNISGAVSAASYSFGDTVTITSGGSLYLRTDGGVGGHLYVSSGSGWNSITGV